MVDERDAKDLRDLKSVIDEVNAKVPVVDEDPHAHHFHMPRFSSCLSKRRTIIHTLSVPQFPVAVGDRLLLHPAPNFPRAMIAHVTWVSQVHLQEVIEADLAGVDTDLAHYIASWDATFPQTPVSSNPEVTRILFAYGEPPKTPG